MEVRVIELPPVTLAYLRHTGPFGPALGAFWRDVFNPWCAAHGLKNRTTYGIAQDDPSRTPPDQCRYDACVEVADDYVVPAPAAVTRFPGGRFAAVRYRGPSADIGNAWTEFYSKALPASGLQSVPGPCFERYDASYAEDAATGVFECDLCIPIK